MVPTNGTKITPASRRPRGTPVLRSRWIAGGALGALLVLAAACGSSASSPSTTKAPAARTSSASTGVVSTAQRGSLGVILVDQKGRTLYRYTPDGVGKTTCTGTCATVWPPLTVPSGTVHVTAGHGVAASSLGTITRPGGALQVTFKGMPLYLYQGDATAGATKGQGVEGTWFVLTASGSTPPTTAASPSATKPAAPAAAPAPSGGGSGSAATMPATAPPATSPPATSPPATAPPATAPPVTAPPATSPPATSPPTTAGGGGYGY